MLRRPAGRYVFSWARRVVSAVPAVSLRPLSPAKQFQANDVVIDQ